MIIPIIVVPIICGIFYRLGGSDHPSWLPKWFSQKLFRTIGIGLVMGGVFAVIQKSFFPLLCVGTYWLPDCFPYGEKSWMKIQPEWKFFVNGLAFGIASFPALGLVSIYQAFIAGTCFSLIYLFNTKGWIMNPWEERVRGFLGTICSIL